MKEKVCIKCCESGHEERVCHSRITCGMCKANKLDNCDHSVLSEDCPIFGMNLDRFRKRINND